MGDMFKGQERSPKPDQQFKNIYVGLNNYLGGLSKLSRGQVGPWEQTMFNATRKFAPQYNQLEANMYKNIAPQYAQTQNKLANIAGGGELDRMKSFGMSGVDAAQSKAESIDAPFYAGRGMMYDRMNNLLNGPQVSGGEMEAMARGINRMGGGQGNVQGAANTAANAQLFGGAARNRMVENTQLASGILPQLKTTDMGQIFNMSRSFGNNANTNLQAADSNKLDGAGKGFVPNLINTAQGGQIAMMNNNAQRPAMADYTSNAVGSICCFIFMEALNGKLPWYVIMSRDRYYAEEPKVAIGYKKMAKWLVPLMKRSKLVKHIVNLVMVKPLIAYGGYDYCVNKYGKFFKPVKDFWFNIWRNS